MVECILLEQGGISKETFKVGNGVMNFKFDGTENELFERVRFSEDGRGKEGEIYTFYSV